MHVGLQFSLVQRGSCSSSELGWTSFVHWRPPSSYPSTLRVSRGDQLFGRLEHEMNTCSYHHGSVGARANEVPSMIDQRPHGHCPGGAAASVSNPHPAPGAGCHPPWAGGGPSANTLIALRPSRRGGARHAGRKPPSVWSPDHGSRVRVPIPTRRLQPAVCLALARTSRRRLYRRLLQCLRPHRGYGSALVVSHPCGPVHYLMGLALEVVEHLGLDPVLSAGNVARRLRVVDEHAEIF